MNIASQKLVAAIIGVLTVGSLAFAGPMCAPWSGTEAAQAADSPSPSFEVASIKPNHSNDELFRYLFSSDGFSATGLSLKDLIGYAYNMKDFQISGAQGWIDSEKYDIEAKMDESTIAALKKLAPEQAIKQRQRMVQSLLAERFNLKVSHSSKEAPIYALVVAKNGPKLTKSADSPAGPSGPGAKSRMRIGGGELTATAIPMSTLADQIAREVGRTVVDKTGLEGRYDFTMHWISDRQGLREDPADTQAPAPPADSSGSSIFTALQEQLGLKLESQKGPVETLIIETVERPSPN